MSQSVTVTAIFRNNKRINVGLHNPHNNRPFNETERIEFMDRLDKYINIHTGKFKKVIINDLGEALQIVKADPFLKAVDRDEWMEIRY